MAQPKTDFTPHYLVSSLMILILTINIIFVDMPLWLEIVLGFAVVMNIVVLIILRKITSQSGK